MDFYRKNDISLIEGNWRNFVIMTECSDKLNCKGTKNVTFDYFDISILLYGTEDSLKLIYAKITKIFLESGIVKRP